MNKVILSLLGLVLYCSGATINAVHADWTIHTVSAHVGVKGLNPYNPGIGYDVTDKVRVGALYNSYKKPSGYALYIVPLHPRFRFGAGLISGYKLNTNTWEVSGKTGSIIPAVALEADITRNVSAVWFGQAINLELKF